jgi:hypothetical protein
MLRKISLLLNSAVVVLSLLLFGYTFFAKEHLVEHTRAFVTERTLAHSKPLVELMRAGLDAPLAQKLVSEKIRLQIEGELGLYDSDPIEYVDKLTSESAPSFGTGKLAKFKESVHAYYQSTLAALVRDLRIFSGSNLVAGIFAIWLLLNGSLGRNGKVVAFSFVVFTAVAYSSYSYIEGVSFLRILFKSHLGWWYPAGIALTILGLFIEHGLLKKKDTES